MARWYLIRIQTSAGLKRLYARSVAKRDGSLQVGIGMKADHRSCLILTMRGTTCAIDGISTWTKGFVERKNPLRLTARHLETWLSIANDLAYLNKCTVLELFDAANVLAHDGVLQFLSRLTLLRNDTFLYEQYGFESIDAERADGIRDRVKSLRDSGLSAHDPTSRVDHAFDQAGLEVPSMQMRFERLVSKPSIVMSVEPIVPKKWMDKYTDAVMDVY